jgi:hypothetical protein
VIPVGILETILTKWKPWQRVILIVVAIILFPITLIIGFIAFWNLRSTSKPDPFEKSVGNLRAIKLKKKLARRLLEGKRTKVICAKKANRLRTDITLACDHKELDHILDRIKKL